MIQGRCTCAPWGKSCTPTRSAAYAPNFINTPACIIETAVGAATWPSGLQLWNGNKPASTPNPMNTNGNQNLAIVVPNTPSVSNGPGSPVTGVVELLLAFWLAANAEICCQREAASRCEKSKLYAGSF